MHKCDKCQKAILYLYTLSLVIKLFTSPSAPKFLHSDLILSENCSIAKPRTTLCLIQLISALLPRLVTTPGLLTLHVFNKTATLTLHMLFSPALLNFRFSFVSAKSQMQLTKFLNYCHTQGNSKNKQTNNPQKQDQSLLVQAYVNHEGKSNYLLTAKNNNRNPNIN